ncbi:hypothetical protein [Ensifer soli]|uniref:hypothetical protein n=1 Tax=Ciceribacter sp. sgz301302 TaxID=3342379 RepID=UPI0035B90720
MTASTILLLAYAMVTIFFLLRTHEEGEISGAGWDRSRIAGLMACVAWPVVLVVVAAVVFRASRSTRVSA